MHGKSQQIQIIAIFIVTIVLVLIMLFFWFRNISPILNSTELHERAEVIGKKIVEKNFDDTITSTYIVTFKFSDGSLKELWVGVDRAGEESYYAINEGDIGTLTYKEIKAIEQKYKNEDIRWEGRRFISFMKDSEYGGTKIEKRGLTELTVLIIGIGFFISLAIIFIVTIIVNDKKN